MMTDQSRLEAVADAVGNARNRQGNFAISSPGDALAIAQAAITANDAWLKARGWKAVPHTMTSEMAMHAVAVQPLSGWGDLQEVMKRGWRVAVKFAPSLDDCLCPDLPEPNSEECPLHGEPNQ